MYVCDFCRGEMQTSRALFGHANFTRIYDEKFFRPLGFFILTHTPSTNDPAPHKVYNGTQVLFLRARRFLEAFSRSASAPDQTFTGIYFAGEWRWTTRDTSASGTRATTGSRSSTPTERSFERSDAGGPGTASSRDWREWR